MLDHTTEDRLIDELQDLHALARSGRRRIELAIATAGDDDLRRDLRAHLDRTRDHVLLLEGCLSAHGETAEDRAADAGTAPADDAPGDDVGRELRDVREATEAGIAGHRLLERLAEGAADEETAEVARTIRAQEEALAARLAGHPTRSATPAGGARGRG